MSKISLTTSLGVSAATTPRRDGTSSTLPIKAWRPTSPNDTSDGSAAWATVLSPDASRAFVDREHLALLPHRDLLDRPSNRGIRTTPREEPMTTSLYGRGQACVRRTRGRRIRLLIRIPATGMERLWNVMKKGLLPDTLSGDESHREGG